MFECTQLAAGLTVSARAVMKLHYGARSVSEVGRVGTTLALLSTLMA